jgi:hypothetical protein
VVPIGQGVILAIAAFIAACTDDASSRIAAPGTPTFAKSGGTTGPSVQSTNPSYSHRDTTLDVHVLGSGFSAGAKAAWSLAGDTTLVHVNRTTYVSSGEVIANVTVPAGAPLATYDVAVTLLSGKKGVGSELFEVTAAEPLLLSGRVVDNNDLGGIVGGTDTAFYYDDTCGVINLGAAEGWGLDPQGMVVSGRTHKPDPDLMPAVWVRTGQCSFTRQMLPNPGGGGGFAKSVARDGSGAIIVGGVESKTGKPAGVAAERPALWARSGSTWLGPTYYSTPNGQGEIWRINGSAMAVGRSSEASGQVGYIWNTPTDYTAIDGLPFGINDAGTIAVGFNNSGQDVYWTKNPSTARWDPVGHVLPGPDGGPGVGTAFDVNTAGIIVGRVTVGAKVKASVWQLDLSVYPPVPIGGVKLLSGLGPSTASEASSAKSITNVPIDGYYIIAGMASSAKAYAVRWRFLP